MVAVRLLHDTSISPRRREARPVLRGMNEEPREDYDLFRDPRRQRQEIVPEPTPHERRSDVRIQVRAVP